MWCPWVHGAAGYGGSDLPSRADSPLRDHPQPSSPLRATWPFWCCRRACEPTDDSQPTNHLVRTCNMPTDLTGGGECVRGFHVCQYRVRLCAVRVRVLGGPDTDREHDAGRMSASVCACSLECGCVPCQLAVDTSTSTPTDSPTRAPLCIILATCVC